MLSEDLAARFDVSPGDVFTLFRNDYGRGFSFVNFVIAGTVRFGTTGLDRGAVLMDLEDARSAFAMEDAAGEDTGFFASNSFDEDLAQDIAARFNDHFNQYTEEAEEDAEFSPTMLTLSQQEGMAQILVYSKAVSAMLIAYSRCGFSHCPFMECGPVGRLKTLYRIRGPDSPGRIKSHIYRSLIWEALMIGALGSVLGTGIGVAPWYTSSVPEDLIFPASYKMQPF